MRAVFSCEICKEDIVDMSSSWMHFAAQIFTCERWLSDHMVKFHPKEFGIEEGEKVKKDDTV